MEISCDASIVTPVNNQSEVNTVDVRPRRKAAVFAKDQITDQLVEECKTPEVEW